MIREKIQQVRAICGASQTAFPLVLDALRRKRSDYLAECGGLHFELKAGVYDWYTIYENVIRQDYFFGGINLRPGGTVIDIGANFGSFTAVASRKVGPTGKVIAFEPNPPVFKRLKRNIEINALTNTTAHNVAVSSKDGTLVLFVHGKAALATTFAEIDNRSSSDATGISVPTTSARSILASVDGTIDLLKLDCEGAEYEILESLDRESARPIRQIAMETHQIPGRSDKEIVTMLSALGFEVKARPPLVVAFNTAADTGGPRQ